MWAFIPAMANWIGRMRRSPRFANSGRHAFGTGLPSSAAATAARYRSANVTSSAVMDAGSPKNPSDNRASTSCVTSRYIRLNAATPSPAGSPSPIAVSAATTSDTSRGCASVSLMSRPLTRREPVRRG
jgi:hypothetical protein